MMSTFHKNFQAIESKIDCTHFQKIKRGFEKESLRVVGDSSKVLLAKTPHPEILGSTLTHPFITTDYSESLLEFITPPTSSINKLFEDLTNIHRYTYHMLEKNNEYLWVSSMPCPLPSDHEIPIAVYGKSNYGQLKHIYRRGLGLRYGRSMQTIAGVHYNFSFPESFFAAYRELKNVNVALKDFISEQYFGLIRNCFRLSYILPVLFGASPAADSHFVKNTTELETDWPNTVYGKCATSLRLSDVGYHNNTRALVDISYNSLKEFLKSMRHAIHLPYPEYVKLGVKRDGEYQQLSDCLLQFEAEHYALIRPKRATKPHQRMLKAIEQDGVEYVEIRALDLNPFSPVGVEKEAVYLLDCFLLVCLLSDSPPLDSKETKQIQNNMNKVLKFGRKKDLKIQIQEDESEGHQDILFSKWSIELLEKMQLSAQLFDKAYGVDDFSNACYKAKDMILNHHEQLLSSRVLTEMLENDENFVDFANRVSRMNQDMFLQDPLPDDLKQDFEQLAKVSLQEQLDIEKADTLHLDDYINQYLED